MDCPGNNKRWYGLHVRPRFEKIVAQHLQQRGYEGYLPLCRNRRQWSDRVKEIETPLFPGYLFCRFEAAQRLPILIVPGVLSLVGSGKQPLPIPDEEIMALQSVTQSGLRYEPSGFITAGQIVRVERGPLRGMVGIASSHKNNNCRFVISVNLLRRSVSVDLDSDCLHQYPVIRSV
jgi:transcription antitermination factor NusG